MNAKVKPQHNAISSPYAKFCIGFIAGCAAILIPRFSGLFAPGTESELTQIPTYYFIITAILAALIGAIIVISEFRVPKAPIETFFAALAVPGLIAGSVNTASISSEVKASQAHNQILTQEVQLQNNLPKEIMEAPTIIEFDIPASPSSGIELNFSVLSEAHADSHNSVKTLNSENTPIITQGETPTFAVSIGEFQNKQDAINKAISVRKLKPSVTIIKTNNEYRVITSRKLLTETEATIEALVSKRELNVQPTLIQVK